MMTDTSYIIIVLSIIIILFLCVGYTSVFKVKSYFTVENNNIKKYTYYHCGKYNINKSLLEIFKNKNIEKTLNPDKADIYLACGYTNVEEEYNKLPQSYKNHFIHAVQGCDKIVAKNMLWVLLKNYYGTNASNYTPNTYLLRDYNDKLKLLKNSKNNPSDILILKKNIQRQEGLKFILKKDVSISNLNNYSYNQYVIAQDYLDNPFTIHGRKINLRVYLLFIIINNIKYAYLYQNGFVYYTKNTYKYSIEPDQGVTTGYVDRKIYEQNPLTHLDLKHFLKQNGYNPKLLFDNIKNLVIKVLDAVSPVLNSTKGKVNYQLFGLDIQPDKNFVVKLIEINKGVSLQYMDKKDGELKKKLQEDIYKTLNIIDDNNNNNDFVLIWKK